MCLLDKTCKACRLPVQAHDLLIYWNHNIDPNIQFCEHYAPERGT